MFGHVIIKPYMIQIMMNSMGTLDQGFCLDEIKILVDIQSSSCRQSSRLAMNLRRQHDMVGLAKTYKIVLLHLVHIHGHTVYSR